ncbi:claudin-9-like [Haplochromis burtoni]|uniref:claudin-9-like n=1 Tax=Haplochromis burtoni TaxID=8153 RepID=UPI0003BD3B19|nr:claudin-9-like [Haplochromis burtoni]XP_042078267.1 claudin-9-like [Haplochromis burtoni]
MTAGVRHLLGLTLAIISFVGTIVICALPQWRVTKILEQSSIFDSLVFTEGLWKVCGTFSAQILACKKYEETLLPISQDLEVARALIVIAIISGVIGILLGAAGSKFMNFVPDERKRSKMAMASGVVCLIAGIFVLIPVCWTTNATTTTIQDNYNNFLPHVSLKSELGASLYIGWITTALLFLGGGLLCSSFICQDGTD